MEKPLRVLIVEDVEQDALRTVSELERGGFDVTFERVDTLDGMREALSATPWEIVISDYALQRFDAHAALDLVKELELDVPFIIVSGSVGEEDAIEAMRAGAQDYLHKERLARLVPAVERELREARGRAEQRRMEEQLLISDRMASVGTLAAGIAHEINNPLAALLSNVEFARDSIARLRSERVAAPAELDAKLGELDEPLADAHQAADRVRLIVRDLRLFSRSGEDERRMPVDVVGVLESSLRMAQNEIRHRARLVKDLAPVRPVLANESRLGQVFVNLLVNAAEAIPEGRAAANEIRVGTFEDGPEVVVEVQDSGAGISKESLPRVFDLFFTTKPRGVGAGLGLAICHRIVTGLGGTIAVKSEPGKGALFRVRLPISRTNVDTVRPANTFPRAARRCKLLVVDDEEMIGIAVQRLLFAEHDVDWESSARGALERLARQRYDLILCDMMMPEMTGADFHAAVSETAPEQAERIVFMTGGAFTAGAREFLDRVPNSRLDKPFDLSALKKVIDDVLPAPR